MLSTGGPCTEVDAEYRWSLYRGALHQELTLWVVQIRSLRSGGLCPEVVLDTSPNAIHSNTVKLTYYKLLISWWWYNVGIGFLLQEEVSYWRNVC